MLLLNHMSSFITFSLTNVLKNDEIIFYVAQSNDNRCQINFCIKNRRKTHPDGQNCKSFMTDGTDSEKLECSLLDYWVYKYIYMKKAECRIEQKINVVVIILLIVKDRGRNDLFFLQDLFIQ